MNEYQEEIFFIENFNHFHTFFLVSFIVYHRVRFQDEKSHNFPRSENSNNSNHRILNANRSSLESR